MKRILLLLFLFLCGSVSAQRSGKALSSDRNVYWNSGPYQTDRLRELASEGSSDDAVSLGLIYQQGLGVETDMVQAVGWFRRAAEAGHAEAQVLLGNCYRDGIGVEADIDEAFVWYEKASAQAGDEGLTLQGRRFLTDGSRDERKAFRCFKKAAEAGHAEAQHLLGDCCLWGTGTMQDASRAAVWYRKAAKQGYKQAQLALCACYRNGIGVQRNSWEADLWEQSALRSTADIDSVEKMPEFQGGDINTFRNWVQKQVVYPQIARENGISGRVVVRFIIEKDGQIGDIQVLSSPAECLSNEVIRIVRSSPRWEPGSADGEPVRVRYTLPVDFVFSGGEQEPNQNEYIWGSPIQRQGR